MSELELLRDDISKIDGKMAQLFEKRMEISKKIAAYKTKNGLCIKDRKREDEVIINNLSLVDESVKSYYEEFLKNVISLSCRYQEDLSKEV